MTTQQQNSRELPPLSIILEWDNIRLSEMGRSRAMLQGLYAQVQDLRRQARELSASETNHSLLKHFIDPVELLVTYNSEHIEESKVREIVAGIMPPENGHLQIRFLGARGLNYYQLKNFGAQNVNSELIIFVDCDTIPDEDWLINLLLPFEDPEVEVVGGIQYIEPRTIYSKTFALTWLFPLRSEEKQVIPFTRFWAGNVAFRRATFTRFQFPEFQDMGRGACRLLATTLLQNGVKIYRSTAAQLNHPAPNGVRHFIMRAISHGRDRLLIVKRTQGAAPITVPQSFQFFKANVRRSFRTIIKDRSRVALSTLSLPIAITIAGCYYLFYFAGEMMTHLTPRLMTNRFKL